MDTKHLIVDVDGTLVEHWTATPRPGVVTLLREVQRHGNVRVSVATNQAGPLWGLLIREDRYPDVETVANRVLEIAQRLHLRSATWVIAVNDERALKTFHRHDVMAAAERVQFQLYQHLHHPWRGLLGSVFISSSFQWRKPKPGMLGYACSALTGIVDRKHTCYMGDMESDQQAAQAAGLRFFHADDHTGLLQWVKEAS